MPATGSFTNQYESMILNLLFGGNPLPALPYLYLGYMVGVASDQGPGAEPNGGGYSRVAVANNSANWPIASNMIKLNGSEIVFNEATANHGTVQAIGVFDSPSQGYLIAWMPLENPITVGVRDAMKIPIGGLQHSFQASGGLSTYAKNAILNHVYGATPFNVIGLLYFGYSTTASTDTTGGTEPAVGGYARSAVTNNAAVFPPTSTGSKTNFQDINFPEATATQGTMVGIVVYDAASGGNLIASSVLSPPQAIGLNTEPRIRANTITFNLDLSWELL